MLYCVSFFLEKTDATMQNNHRQILRKHFRRLVEDVEPDPVLRYLYEKGIIKEEDMEAIRSRGTRNQMNEALLIQLNRKGSDAFKRLVEALRENQRSLADILSGKGNKSIKYDESLNLETHREIG